MVSATSSTGDLDVILKGGELREHDVLHVLGVFHARLLTGVIEVRGAKDFRASIFTMDGDIIAAEAADEAQRLGRRLVRKGLVKDADLKASLKAAKPNQRIGEVLIARGFVDDEAVQRALTEQFKDVLFLCCILQQGTYRAEVKDVVFPHNTQLLFETPELIGQAQGLRNRLGDLVTALHEGSLGLAPGSAALTNRLKGPDLAIVTAADNDRRIEHILEKSPLEQIETLEIITGLLERRVLALAPVKNPSDDSNASGLAGSAKSKGSFISSLRRGEDGSGQFTSRDTVLDVVDLSSVSHFAVATDIPLTGVVETLGVEDLDEAERAKTQREAQSVNMGGVSESKVKPQRGPSPSSSAKPGVRSPKRGTASKDRGTSTTPPLMAPVLSDEDDDDLLFTEDGQAVPSLPEEPGETQEQAESLIGDIAKESARRIERRSQPTTLLKLPPQFEGATTDAGDAKEAASSLTPHQRQSLHRRFHIYNQIFQTLFTHFCQYARKLEVLTHFQGYFAMKGQRYPELVQGASFRTNGTLKPDIILDNLDARSYEHPAEAFDLALHDILSYLLKDARKLLPNAEAEARMMEAVAEVRRQLFRRGANVPPLGR